MMRSRTIWIGTSWKMNKTLGEALAFAEMLRAEADAIVPAIQPFVIPPFTAVRQVKEALADTRVKVGAQNMHWADGGAWTGEISPSMLADCGADMVELGHSERRAHFGETDETVGLKVAAALRHRLAPLVCVGETMEDREGGRSDAVLARQVEGALGALEGPVEEDAILFAYEPVWAIGEHGVPASADYADARQERIRDQAEQILGWAPAVLYGGSVNPGNCEELVAQPSIDGLFIGRAAWAAEGYLGILAQCADIIGKTMEQKP